MVAPKILHHEFNVIIEPPTEDDRWWIAYCPEVPGANGQGETEEGALADLKDAIQLVLETRLEEGLRGIPENAKSGRVTLG